MKLCMVGLGTALFALLAVGCTSDDTPNSALNASLLQSCGPTDGPAMILFLTEQPAAATQPERPYTSVTLFRTATEMAGKRFTISSNSFETGVAQDCPATGDCTNPPSVTATFGDFNTDSTMSVDYKLTLNGDRKLIGSAVARIHPLQGLCG